MGHKLPAPARGPLDPSKARTGVGYGARRPGTWSRMDSEVSMNEAAAYVPDEEHQRPEGASDELVEAVGKVSEALEWVERLRGRLFDFHQMMGRADFLFGDAADALDEAGCHEMAEMLRTEVVGRNVLNGRWTFQMVEEFEAHYYDPVREAEERIRNELMGGKRHVFEAELKEQRRTRGHRDHSSRPGDDG